jgi:hypothetical protein
LGRKVKPFTDEHKAKIGLGNKRRIWSDVSRNKLRASKIGILASEETKQKLREIRKDCPFGEKVKHAKLSNSQVNEVFYLRSIGWTHNSISTKYSVSRSHITGILLGTKRIRG